METLRKIVNNDMISSTFFNLYDRWQDESEYEDIKEYGKAIANTIAKEFPTLGVTLAQATKRPFGAKIDTNKGAYQLWIKLKGHYATICGKRLR